MKRKIILIILLVIGVILIYSVLSSIYRINKLTKGYEIVEAVCISEAKHRGNEGEITYGRVYSYIIEDKEYTLHDTESSSKPYKLIKYNPINPYEATIYSGFNISDFVVLLVGIILIASPLILKVINTKNISEYINKTKYKLLKRSEKSILRIITICFWIYISLSLVFAIRDVFLELDLNPELVELTNYEISIELFTYIARCCNFKESIYYTNIFSSNI